MRGRRGGDRRGPRTRCAVFVVPVDTGCDEPADGRRNSPRAGRADRRGLPGKPGNYAGREPSGSFGAESEWSMPTDGPPRAWYVGTVFPDGAPQVSPMWVALEGEGELTFNTSVGRVKEENPRHDPRVYLSHADAADPFDRVQISGVVDPAP